MVKQEIQAAIAPLRPAGAHPHGREEQVCWHSNGGTAHTRSARQQTGSTTRGSLSKGGWTMEHRVQRHIVLVLVSCLLAGLVLTASAQMATGPIEPGAGGWRTWVLASGKELRLPPPPDAQATATELQELLALAGRRDAAVLERIRYWDFWSPAHRWNELLIDTRVAQNRFGSDGYRAFVMLNVAIHDALIAAWEIG